MTTSAHGADGVSELPLILFTLLTPMSVGVALVALLSGGGVAFAAVTVALATLGMIASVAHLAKPLRAPFSLRHWRESWLSREILAVSAYWGLLLVWGALVLVGPAPAASVMNGLAAVAGVGLLFVIAEAYRMRPRPAWDGPENVLELVAVACGAGCSLGVLAALLIGDSFAAWWGIVPLVAALVLLATAHRRRLERLEAAEPTPAIDATLVNYRSLMLLVKRSLMLQTVAIAVTVVSLVLFVDLVGVVPWGAAFVLEVAAHFGARRVFYDLPVQMRFVPRFR